MKIALCFSGQNRTGHVTADNIKRYVGDLLPDCDVFAHFWDSETRGTGYANRIGAVSTDTEWHSPKLSDHEKFVEFYRQWAPRTIMVEEYDLQPNRPKWGGRRFDPVEQKWHVSMWRSLYEANKLKQDYAQKNQITYDYTVRLRSDLVFDAGKSLAEDLALIQNPNMFLFGDHYAIWPIHGMGRIEDILWIGPSKLMDQISTYYATYTNTVTNIDDPHQPGYQDWQWHSANWVVNQLGYQFYALQNNQMRIYTEQDIDDSIDPMNPGFGPGNKPGAFHNKNI
jgi:hypothetical protein|tara:strand:- start:23 stop:868 length:846 start_codon:yes stop_codon:yes gene_type:complete